jgi:hypothetical protein
MSHDASNDRPRHPDPLRAGIESASRIRLPEQSAALAARAVEILALDDFIQERLDALFAKLEQFDHEADTMPMNSDLMFGALSLPVANAVIHVASTPARLRDARAWLAGWWGGEPSDVMNVLSALVLIYIVMSMWDRYHADAEHRHRAIRIVNRVQKLGAA